MRTKATFSTSEEGKALRALHIAPPRLQHRLTEVVISGGRRPCVGGRCVKHKVCPYGSRPDLPPHCLALELHLRRFGRVLRKETVGPIPSALLGIILRREELVALAGWWLSETEPFDRDAAGRVSAQAIVEQYRGLLREQASDLRALGAQRFERPDPAAVFAEALHAAIDATPTKNAPVSAQNGSGCVGGADG